MNVGFADSKIGRIRVLQNFPLGNQFAERF
jgi:hypothetical protein